MSTLEAFYAGCDVQCPECREWAPADEYYLVGDEGFECPNCEMIDTGSIPQSRKRDV